VIENTLVWLRSADNKKEFNLEDISVAPKNVVPRNQWKNIWLHITLQMFLIFLMFLIAAIQFRFEQLGLSCKD
jgi:hypothetical protein